MAGKDQACRLDRPALPSPGGGYAWLARETAWVRPQRPALFQLLARQAGWQAKYRWIWPCNLPVQPLSSAPRRQRPTM